MCALKLESACFLCNRPDTVVVPTAQLAVHSGSSHRRGVSEPGCVPRSLVVPIFNQHWDHVATLPFLPLWQIETVLCAARS